MKDRTEEQLRATRPRIPLAEAAHFCLRHLFEDDQHRLRDEVLPGLCFEELIGALLLAEDAARGEDGQPPRHPGRRRRRLLTPWSKPRTGTYEGVA